MKGKLKKNKNTWNNVAHYFLEASALPVWGPFGVGKDLDLIPEIKNKTFLELCCGSGRSIKYLTQKGAQHVVGLDFSDNQIRESKKFNKQEIEIGKVNLICSAMEEKQQIDPVDIVFSVYGFGWTQDPKTTLVNVFSYLKPGGLFIWSWDHSIFTDIIFKNKNFIVDHSYHNEKLLNLKSWKGQGAHLAYRKTSTWFELQKKAGFDVIGYYEPKPVNLNRGYKDPEKYYSIQKAELVPCTMIFVCQKPF